MEGFRVIRPPIRVIKFVNIIMTNVDDNLIILIFTLLRIMIANYDNPRLLSMQLKISRGLDLRLFLEHKLMSGDDNSVSITWYVYNYNLSDIFRISQKWSGCE